MFKNICRLFPIFLSILWLGCSSVPKPGTIDGNSTLAVSDDLGRQVNLPLNPHRVISLSPEATEIICALGASETLVATVLESDYPVDTKKLTQVGSFSSPSYEGILGLAPDLVVATGHEQASFVHQLEAAGVNVVAIYPKDIAKLQQDIRMLGEILGRQKEGEKLAKEIGDGLTAVQTAVLGRVKPRVFIEIADEPLMTASTGSMVDQLLTIAGGENIAPDLPRPYCRIEPEQVLAANPEVIVLAHTSATAADVSGRPGWNSIAAVRNGRIISDIDPSLLFRAGPRMVMGAWALVHAFYPDITIPEGMLR